MAHNSARPVTIRMGRARPAVHPCLQPAVVASGQQSRRATGFSTVQMLLRKLWSPRTADKAGEEDEAEAGGAGAQEVQLSLGLAAEGAPVGDAGAERESVLPTPTLATRVERRELQLLGEQLLAERAAREESAEPACEGAEVAGAGEVGEADSGAAAGTLAGVGTAEGEGEAEAEAAMEAELRRLDADREAAEAALLSSFAVRRTSLEGEAKAEGGVAAATGDGTGDGGEAAATGEEVEAHAHPKPNPHPKPRPNPSPTPHPGRRGRADRGGAHRAGRHQEPGHGRGLLRPDERAQPRHG